MSTRNASRQTPPVISKSPQNKAATLLLRPATIPSSSAASFQRVTEVISSDEEQDIDLLRADGDDIKEGAPFPVLERPPPMDAIPSIAPKVERSPTYTLLSALRRSRPLKYTQEREARVAQERLASQERPISGLGTESGGATFVDGMRTKVQISSRE